MLHQIKLNELFLGMVLFTLPVSMKANSIALIIFFIYNLYRRIENKTFSDLKRFTFNITVILIHLVAFFNSDDMQEASKKLILFSSFLIFPFFYNSGYEKIKLEKILMFLVYGVILITIYAFINSLYDILVLNARYDYGRGINLLLQYIPHHTYFSMYIVASILLLAYRIGDSQINKYFLFFLPFLYLMIFFLPSRTVIFFSIIILPFFVFYFLKKRFDKSKMILVLALSFLILLIIGLSFDYARDKLVYAYYEITSTDTDDKPFYGISRRKMIWEANYDLIKGMPLFGYGIGDAQNFLNITYKAKNYNEVFGMNSHNQYLQNIINYGLPLSVIFFGMVLSLLLKLLKKKEILLVGIWFIILSVFLTESVLNRQWGVIFFSFIFTFSSYVLNEKKK